MVSEYCNARHIIMGRHSRHRKNGHRHILHMFTRIPEPVLKQLLFNWKMLCSLIKRKAPVPLHCKLFLVGIGN